jgi:hypothetical protein
VFHKAARRDQVFFSPVLVFPNYKPPLLCVAPGFCARPSTNKTGIRHQSLFVTSISTMNREQVSFRLPVSCIHTLPMRNIQQRPPAFSEVLDSLLYFFIKACPRIYSGEKSGKKKSLGRITFFDPLDAYALNNL